MSDPPREYEGLIRLIHERHAGMSATYQRIATYLTQDPNDVAVSSVGQAAARCGVHASSVVRFAQALGYAGFTELQSLFRQRLATAAPGFEARVRALGSELEGREDLSDAGFLRDLVLRDIASLQGLLADINRADLEAAADLLHRAGTVYLAGQLRAAPVADLLRYVLTMVGKRCLFLDAAGGLATHMARSATPGDALVAVSFRFYANETVGIVRELAEVRVPVIAITDSCLSPIARDARLLFTIPEHDYTFSRSLAAPMCLAQALALGVASRAQGSASPRIDPVTAP